MGSNLMRKRTRVAILILAFTPACLCSRLFGEDRRDAAVIGVDAGHPGAAISPTMFGIFFEDINFAADGGLYPELVKNRSFEFNEPLAAWHEIMVLNATGIDP